MTYQGMHVVVSAAAVATTYHWPSKNRSKRLIKKMTKLRGPQITAVPQALILGSNMIVHPTIYAELKRQCAYDSTKYSALH